MENKEQQLIEKGVEIWRKNKGIGSFIIPKPMNPLLVISSILPKLFNRSPTINILIVINNFDDRNNIIEHLTKSDNQVYNDSYNKLISSGNIKIWSKDYAEKHITYVNSALSIIYKPTDFNYVDSLVLSKSRFRVVVLNKLLDKGVMNKIYAITPLINVFKQKEIDQIRANRPVEESRIGLTITDDKDSKLIKYYDEEISRSICIFGSLDNINIARVGDKASNMSAIDYCSTLAEFNGWRFDLDMTSEFNRQLDEIYNPNSLKERAEQVYDIIRKRSTLLANNDVKLNVILDIVKSNADKKILIINKYPSFATVVTEYLNVALSETVCMNYHDKLESIEAVDINGDPIYIKSGVHKGERKMLGVTGQKNLARDMFNTNKIHVLSTNNLPDKTLNVNVDIVIITSPFCEDMETYLYRMTYLSFKDKIVLYTLFCKNTIEERAFERKKLSSNHIIVNSSEIEYIDNKNSDIILVD